MKEVPNKIPKPRGGARKGAGGPGYSYLQFIKTHVNKFSPLWWTEWEKMMKNTDVNLNVKSLIKKGLTELEVRDMQERRRIAVDFKKVAMQEFNKLQQKFIPTTLANDEENPINVGVVILPQKNDDTLATKPKAS